MGNHLMEILKAIESKTNFDARFYRKSTLERRLKIRIMATNSRTYKKYLDYLKKDAAEYPRFLETLTINVSGFFRDRPVFQTLEKKILPELLATIKNKSQKRVSIWSVGCSKGQEPYSLAMICLEVLKGNLQEFRISILATDMNKNILTKAKQGIYSPSEVKNVPKDYLQQYFQPTNGGYQIKDEVKKLVKFRQHDLIKGKHLGKFHLILCRNLFIFFEPQLQEKMYIKLHASLKKHGLLVLGTAETPRDDRLFSFYMPKVHIYQHKEINNI